LVHDDRNITVLTWVADAYRKIWDLKKSKQLYLKVLEMEDTNDYAVIGLGHLHYDFKEYKDALYYWTKMLELTPENVDIRVLTSIGSCHRKLKTFDQGLVYFQKALDIDPKNFYALFGMADCYRGMNQQFRSVEYWNKILEIDPNNKVILTRAGDAYRNTGDYKMAADYYNRAMDIDFDIYAALGLALICKGEGKYDEAIDRLSALIRDDPKNYRLYIDLADCHLKKNQKAKAVETLRAYQRQGLRSQAVNEMLERLENNRPLF
jgi:tetratricopeptide (TPR) repeat protein